MVRIKTAVIVASTGTVLMVLGSLPLHHHKAPVKAVVYKTVPTPTQTPVASPSPLDVPVATVAPHKFVAPNVVRIPTNNPTPVPTPDTSKDNVTATPAPVETPVVMPEPTPEVTPLPSPSETPVPTSTPLPMDEADFCRLSQLVDQTPACPINMD